MIDGPDTIIERYCEKIVETVNDNDATKEEARVVYEGVIKEMQDQLLYLDEE
jgi:hypothetical protein